MRSTGSLVILGWMIIKDFYELKKGMESWCLLAQKIQPISSGVEVIAKCGNNPIITINRFGNGHTIYLAADFEDNLLEKIVESALLLSNLTPYLRVLPKEKYTDIIVGARTHESGFLSFLIEIGDREHDVTLEFNRDRLNLEAQKYIVKELISNQQFEINGSNPRLRLQLGKCDVKVLHLILK